MYRIYPQVKQMTMQEGFFHKSVANDSELFFFFGEVEKSIEKVFLDLPIHRTKATDQADVCFIKQAQLSAEAYEISVCDTQIKISYSTQASAYYGALTLKQMMQQSPNKLQNCLISDHPDLKIRGFMLDISRDKVPTVDTIKHIIRMMSQLKMNHLELYVEGFSFGYPSFTQYLEEDGFLSVDEYQELETYAKERFIDLVPNQNGFGHMAKWLETDEFKNLAEKPEGIFLWGRHRKPGTLNPLDPNSLKLIEQLYADMLSISSSPYFNMNFDEPFELGKGKSKEACEKHGVGNVYIDFVLKAYEVIKKYNKIPLIWGDVLIHHPELLHRLPEDMLFIDWGYDGNYPFAAHLKKLHDLKIKFLAAPGTTSWCSYLGRKDDWLENITNAALEVYRLDGEGVILTDWGDFGHLQFLPISYAPLVFTGLYTWRLKEGTQFLLRDYMNRVIFADKSQLLADTLIDLGQYYHYLNDYRSNGTTTFHNFMWATAAINEDHPITYFMERNKATILSQEKHDALNRFFDFHVKSLNEIKANDEGMLSVLEAKQSIWLVRLIQDLNQAYNEQLPREKRLEYVQAILDCQEDFIQEQKRLWLKRNKSGGLQASIAYLERFFLFVLETQKYLQRGEAYGA